MDEDTQALLRQAAACISPQRLQERIAQLSRYVEPGQPPYTRRAFSPAHQEGRRWLGEEFRRAGLEVFTDAGGNLIGALAGQDAHSPQELRQAARLRPLLSGSHTDTVPAGGRYDGMAGVLCALEAAQALGEAAIRLPRTLWIADFLAEEPGEFGTSCIGSRAIAGTLTPSMLDAEGGGETLAQAITRAGGAPAALRRGPIHGPSPFQACLELHIEQGPVLEQGGEAIGIVSGVVGIYRLQAQVLGQADHAGTTPMPLRRDALAGAAQLISALHQEARQAWPSEGLVATVGRLEVLPGGANVVPAAAQFSVDLRAPALEQAKAFWQRITRQVHPRLEALGVQLRWEEASAVPATQFSPLVSQAVGRAAEVLGLSARTLPSGAGHDAMHLAPLAPTGMIFIPCLAGRSHAAEEYASPAAMAQGASAMLGAWLQLSLG